MPFILEFSVIFILSVVVLQIKRKYIVVSKLSIFKKLVVTVCFEAKL